jgi:hypothetical protein
VALQTRLDASLGSFGVFVVRTASRLRCDGVWVGGRFLKIEISSETRLDASLGSFGVLLSGGKSSSLCRKLR